MDPEQKLLDWFTFEGGMYNCKSCNVDKVFKSDRIDNCTRHVNEKHLKQKKQCHDCGKKMTSSSLSRHKKKHCLKRNNLSIVPAHVDEMLPETPPESPTHLGVKEYSVNIKVKFQTLADGTTIVTHDYISIGGLIFNLTPKLADDPIDVIDGETVLSAHDNSTNVFGNNLYDNDTKEVNCPELHELDSKHEEGSEH